MLVGRVSHWVFSHYARWTSDLAIVWLIDGNAFLIIILMNESLFCIHAAKHDCTFLYPTIIYRWWSRKVVRKLLSGA